jgi:ubiquinone/menaquinone biosynthesis C-methylase UbiE
MPDPRAQNELILDQFSRQAEGYGRLTAGMSAEDRRAAFARLIAATQDDIALDVCCGTGALALDLAPYVGQVTGIDLTAAMLEQARAAQARRGTANVEWVEGDALALPFADASFTLVTCSAALHHMRDPRPALAEMARVCRPGGRIVVRDVTPEVDKVAAYDRMERLRDPSHTHALTPEEMARLGEGLPLGPPALHPSLTADLPLEAILATSFPEACTIEDLRILFRADAESGKDRLGFRARLIAGEVRLSYPQTTAIWMRH